MFKRDQVRASFGITKCVFFVITLLNGHTCECRHILYSVKGQNAHLNFPYPCDSTEVTLQHAVSLPFYRSTDGFLPSVPQNQANRFKVQISIENGNCSLDLTISNVGCIDEGTYHSNVYMDGQLHVLDDLTTRIWLGVVDPPDRASCVKVRDKGGDWVAIDCTANIGNLAGKIECYQNGRKRPSLSHPVENYFFVTKSFLIRKSQPAFCCSSTLKEYKERCECNDAALNLADGDSNDPCPPSSIITTRPVIYIVTTNNQADSTGVSPMNMKERKYNESVILISVFVPLLVLLFLLFLLCLFVYYKMKTKTTSFKSNHTARFTKGVHEDEESVTFSFAKNEHD